MNHEDFVALANELRSGDTKRLKNLFTTNSAYCIKNLISLHACSREDAEDIYVDAVLNLREKIVSGKIDAIADVRSYLYGTCKNMFLAGIKKTKRVNAIAAELYAEQLRELDSDATEYHYKEQMAKITWESLGLLSGKCQSILKAFYFDKLSLEQIATKLGYASANVAKASKSRCFQKLVDQVRSIHNQSNLKGNVIK